MAQDPIKAMMHKGQERFLRIRKAELLGESEIQTSFKGSVIFITGGTGFVGKQLLEKLLRSCRGIQKVYLLMRGKKGRTALERLEEQWKDPVFSELRKIEPEFRSRVFAIEGDVAELNLGMKNDVWHSIKDEINFVFHTAATVRFNEPLKKAVLTNVRGTKELLRLANDVPNLKALVYVSTAYANCNQSNEVKEIFYDTPIKPEILVEMVETMEETKLEKMSTILTDGWPNTYTFSKALAENLIKTIGQYLPVCVIRPCIITPTFQEPVVGWLDISNVFGPSGMLLGAGLGVIHSMYAKDTVKPDTVPLDYVNNLTIAAAWDTVRRHQRNERDVMIYTCSRKRNPTTWHDNSYFMNTAARKLVTPKAVWYCYSSHTQYRFLHILQTILLHFIPGLLVDVVLISIGKKPILTKVYQKAYQMNYIVSYFVFKDWLFHDDNTVELRKKMTETDRTIYQFDVADLEFKELLTAWCLGLRKFIVKDELKDTDLAIKRQMWLRLANYIVIAVYAMTVWYILRGLFNIIYLLTVNLMT